MRRIQRDGAVGNNASIPAQRMRHLVARLQRGPEARLEQCGGTERCSRSDLLESRLWAATTTLEVGPWAPRWVYLNDGTVWRQGVLLKLNPVRVPHIRGGLHLTEKHCTERSTSHRSVSRPD
jgi:hypothetical protein